MSIAEKSNLLIVGSGPAGATFARVVSERAPSAKTLMVDAGPLLTAERPGLHLRNLREDAARERAEIRSQGPAQFPYTQSTFPWRHASRAPEGGKPVMEGTVARPGTYLVSDGDGGMPSAAASRCVGGMGVHWACACPAPGNTERITAIPEHEWQYLLARARGILRVDDAEYPLSLEDQAVQGTLRPLFEPCLPQGLRVRRIPLAVRVRDGRFDWTGPDAILGHLADVAVDGSDSFKLLPETLCRRLLVEDGRIAGAVLEHLPSRTRWIHRTDAAVVAADSLHTPQLLWASGIRPKALGHYLNDQPQILSGAPLRKEVIDRFRDPHDESNLVRHADNALSFNVFWIPFHEPGHPFHGQVIHEAVPRRDGAQPSERMLRFCWFARKDIRWQDCVEFLDDASDDLGMPRMTIHYGLTEKDLAAIAAAGREQVRTAEAFGYRMAPDEPRLIPSGNSLHYQGTVRMGEADDGASVCDLHSRVWGVRDLFVAGNGVIPTATACNPTLTSVALAIRAAERVARELPARHA